MAKSQANTKKAISITACLITKDEEKFLARCLSSIKSAVDEIVVVDTGSTDKTIKIAEQYGAKVSTFQWCNDFAVARNASLQEATGDWVLWIDADEELTPESAKEIRKAVQKSDVAGYDIQILNRMHADNDAEVFVHTATRLFQRLPGLEFSGKIHEQVAPSLVKSGLPIKSLAKVQIIHHGYTHEVMQEKHKVARDLEMLEHEVRNNPDNGFQWFNFANAALVASQYHRAEHAARSCIRSLQEGDIYGPPAFWVLCAALSAQERSNEVLIACDEADALEFGGILNEYMRAEAYLKLGQHQEALEPIDKCLKCEWPENMPGDYGIYTHKRLAMKGQILAMLGQFEEALKLLDQALAVNPHLALCHYLKAASLEKLGRADEAIKIYEKGVSDLQIGPLCLKGQARLALEKQEFEKAANLFERAWQMAPSDYEAWVGWAQSCEAWGDAQSIVHAYDSFAKFNEPTAEILVNWGRALEISGEKERALHCYTEAIKRDPDSSNAYFNCGDLLYKLGQYADAAHIYESGLRHAPLYAQGWFVLGNCLTQLGIIDGAKLSYQQALSIKPSHHEARYNLDLISEIEEEQAA